MAALSEAELGGLAEELPDWQVEPHGLVRTAELPSFAQAVLCIVAIADLAEQADHHPDIDLRWRTVHIMLTTHSAGGAVTAQDAGLARSIEVALRSHGAG